MTAPPSPRLRALLTEARRRRRWDQLVGLSIVALAFAGCLLLSAWAHHEATPQVAAKPAPATSAGLEGYPANMDPFAQLERAREVSERDRLRGIVAEGVRSDGQLDVSGKGSVRFSFQSAKGEGPQPPRPKGTLPHRRYCGLQRVRIRSNGIYAELDRPSYPCKSEPVPPLPPPACSTRQIWDTAKALGAPTERVARIEYYRSRAGPAFRFYVTQTRHRYQFAPDCKTQLEQREAVGVVP